MRVRTLLAAWAFNRRVLIEKIEDMYNVGFKPILFPRRTSKARRSDLQPSSWSALQYSHYVVTIYRIAQTDCRIIIYEPFRRDAEGLRTFQDTIGRLQEMERLGMIERLLIQRRDHLGVEFIDLVMVQGGITIEGRRHLDGEENHSRL